MIPYRPDAESELLRAASILHARIDSCHEGAFQPVSPRFQQREVILHLALIAVLKGDLQGLPGDPIEIRVTQTENIGSRFTAVPGAYSRIELTPGRELILFSRAEGTSGAEALADRVCFYVADAGEVALDVACAAAAGCPELRLADLLDRVQGHRASFGPMFALYLVDRLPEAFSGDEIDLRAVLNVLEAPELNSSTRHVLCDGAVGKVLLYSPIAPERLRLLVQSLFRLLLLPEAADLHRNLASTWIPNLVGIEGGSERLNPHDIFRGGALHRQVAGALEQLPDSDAAAPLLAWLR